MAAPSCSECGGTRWVRYFSEATDGSFEEAFSLCPCNRGAQPRSEGHREGAEPKLRQESRPTYQTEEPKQLRIQIELRC